MVATETGTPFARCRRQDDHEGIWIAFLVATVSLMGMHGYALDGSRAAQRQWLL
jgi:hypothetical protein